jgi:hypothetical protein
MRQPALEHVVAPVLDVVGEQRLDVEFAEAAPVVVGIDREHGWGVVLGGRTNDDVAGRLDCGCAAGR